MTERAWLLLAAALAACLYGGWQRMAELSHRLDMVIVVQQSQQGEIERLRSTEAP